MKAEMIIFWSVFILLFIAFVQSNHFLTVQQSEIILLVGLSLTMLGIAKTLMVV